MVGNLSMWDGVSCCVVSNGVGCRCRFELHGCREISHLARPNLGRRLGGANDCRFGAAHAVAHPLADAHAIESCIWRWWCRMSAHESSAGRVEIAWKICEGCGALVPRVEPTNAMRAPRTMCCGSRDRSGIERDTLIVAGQPWATDWPHPERRASPLSRRLDAWS